MNVNGSRLLAGIALAMTLVGAASAQGSDGCWFQDKPAEVAQRKSPHDSASVALDGGTVKVCYGRPHQNGRAVMGKLVPYGEPWRAGCGRGDCDSRSVSRAHCGRERRAGVVFALHDSRREAVEDRRELGRAALGRSDR